MKTRKATEMSSCSDSNDSPPLVEGEGQGGADKSLEVGGEKKSFFLEKGGLGDAKNMFNLPKKGLLIVR
jgi:hypothetical protein